MAKKAAKPQPIEPEDESQEQPEAETPDDTVRNGRTEGKVSKAEAIRLALADGYTSPEAGTDYIRSTFGLDVTRQHFSAAKSQIKSKGGKSGVTVTLKRGRKPKETASPAPAVVAPRKAASVANGEAELLSAMEAIKPLVASLGVDKVKRLADLLA